MTALFFVDANVFVYARDTREPTKQTRAEEWLVQLWRNQTGRTSVQALSEYYVAATRKLRPGVPAADAWDDVSALFSWRPQAVDGSLLIRARDIEQRHRLSWWDCLIVAAAQLQSCSILLSEDLQDGGVYGSVTVRSPFTLTVDEPVPTYTIAEPVPRRRGRPKKSPAARSAA